MNINWTAVDNAARYHRTTFSDGYEAWMLEENGIEHGGGHIRIVDESRYLMFLLRWI